MAAYLSAGGAYGVSKVALNGLTISLAGRAGAVDGTRVVGIAPGMIGSDAVLAHLAPEHKDLVIRMQLVKRFGEIGDLVGMALFLCSSEASFITGQTFLVDGGAVPDPDGQGTSSERCRITRNGRKPSDCQKATASVVARVPSSTDSIPSWSVCWRTASNSWVTIPRRRWVALTNASVISRVRGCSSTG